MATISKTPAGTFKAIIRSNGRIVKTKTFKLIKHAREWAKRIEGDKGAIDAFGCPGATITFNELADEYLEQWTGRDQSLGFKIRYWKAHIGDKFLIDIDAPMIRATLDNYANGKALRGNGLDAGGRAVLVSTGRMRSAGCSATQGLRHGDT